MKLIINIKHTPEGKQLSVTEVTLSCLSLMASPKGSVPKIHQTLSKL